MLSSTFSITLNIPAREADMELRQYAYRQTIGQDQAPDGAVSWDPSDDITMAGRVDVFSLGSDQSRVDLHLAFDGDELAVARRYTRFLDGYKRYSERSAVATTPSRERRAA
jgi:hypothetical protein